MTEKTCALFLDVLRDKSPAIAQQNCRKICFEKMVARVRTLRHLREETTKNSDDLAGNVDRIVLWQVTQNWRCIF